MSNHSVSATTTQTRALKLLVDGVPQNQVAACLGVSESLISQFLAEPDFREELARQKFEILLKHNAQDAALDKLESTLIEKLEAALPLIYKPLELARIFSLVNTAKRRGISSQEAPVQQQTVIQLNLPVQIIQHFQKSATNQVIKAGDQELVTVQSGRMASLLIGTNPSGGQNVVHEPKRSETATASRS
jgi:hypothetical protein